MRSARLRNKSSNAERQGTVEVMAIYHMSVQVIGRSNGRSSTAAAAYRSGERIIDVRTGEVHDYTRKQGVDYKEIMKPECAGEWATNRAELWNMVEQSEKRKDSQLVREINIAIPRELSAVQGRELVREYAQKNFVSKGMVVDLTIHHAEKKNPHAHIMLTMREVGQDGFGQKVREWNEKDQLEKWREEWAYSCNKAFGKKNLNIQISHKSLSEQGIDREATTHLGPTATQMERRGAESDRGNINREVYAKTAELERLQKALQEVTKELAEISKEIEQPQPEKKPVSASAFLKQKEEAKQEPQKQQEMSDIEAVKFVVKNRDFTEVKNIVNKLHQLAHKKDLQTEVKNTPEYKAKYDKISSLDHEAKRSKSVSENFARMKSELGFFNIIERARIAQREKEEKDKYREATFQLTEEKSKLAALEHALTRPGGNLEKNIKAHNERAEKAAEFLKEIAPIYQQRQDEQIKDRDNYFKDLSLYGQWRIISDLENAARVRNIETEIQNSPEHRKLAEQMSTAKIRAYQSKDEVNKIRREKEELGVLQFGKKKELEQREATAIKEAKNAAFDLKLKKEEMEALRQQKTAELSPQIEAHNANTRNALQQLRQLEPIYNERVREAREQERAQNKEIDGYER